MVDNFVAIPAGGQLLVDYGQAFWSEWPNVLRRAESFRKEKERSVKKSLGALVKLET